MPNKNRGKACVPSATSKVTASASWFRRPSCLLLLLLVFFTQRASGQTELPIETKQKELVAQLTGKEELPSGSVLHSRWTWKERALSRKYLQNAFAELGLDLKEQAYRMPNLHAFQDFLLAPFRGANLYGVLPATTTSNEYLLLGAHYDTEKGAPGANDNASAIALIYGVVAALVSEEKRTKNLLIVFFDQEEEDNVGSRAFIRFLAKQPWKIHSVHTIDQMGWDADGDRNIEIELPPEDLRKHYQAAASGVGVVVHVTGVDASDHQAFRAAGYAALGITEEFVNGDTSPYKDTAEDTFDTLNFPFLYSTTELITLVFQDLLKTKRKADEK